MQRTCTDTENNRPDLSADMSPESVGLIIGMYVSMCERHLETFHVKDVIASMLHPLICVCASPGLFMSTVAIVHSAPRQVDI